MNYSHVLSYVWWLCAVERYWFTSSQKKNWKWEDFKDNLLIERCWPKWCVTTRLTNPYSIIRIESDDAKWSLGDITHYWPLASEQTTRIYSLYSCHACWNIDKTKSRIFKIKFIQQLLLRVNTLFCSQFLIDTFRYWKYFQYWLKKHSCCSVYENQRQFIQTIAHFIETTNGIKSINGTYWLSLKITNSWI